MRTNYPFTAKVGQEELMLAIILNVINSNLEGRKEEND